MRLLLKNSLAALLIINLFLLVACSTSPLSIQLRSEIVLAQNNSLLNSKIDWEITSQDQRIEHHLIEISDGKKAATLINESQSSRLIIKDTLQQQWEKKSLIFKENNTNIINIQLTKLLAKVDQKILTHDINSEIIINIKLITKNSIFNKTFRSHFNKEDAFKINIKKMNNQLNTQLSQLLTEIIQDPELNAKLQQR